MGLPRTRKEGPSPSPTIAKTTTMKRMEAERATPTVGVRAAEEVTLVKRANLNCRTGSKLLTMTRSATSRTMTTRTRSRALASSRPPTSGRVTLTSTLTLSILRAVALTPIPTRAPMLVGLHRRSVVANCLRSVVGADQPDLALVNVKKKERRERDKVLSSISWRSNQTKMRMKTTTQP